MKTILRKWFLPWTAAAYFPSRDRFEEWLRRRQRVWTDLRAVLLVLAAVCLLAGCFLDRRPVMLLTIAPLALLLLLSLAMGKIEAALDGQNKSETMEKE